MQFFRPKLFKDPTANDKLLTFPPSGMTGFCRLASQSNYPGIIFTPAETTVSSHDEVIQLLIAVGADVNQGIKRSLTSPRQMEYFTLFDFVQSSIAMLLDLVVEAQSMDIDTPALPSRSLGWNGYRRYLTKTIRLVQSKKRPMSSTIEAESLRSLFELKAYFMNVRQSKIYWFLVKPNPGLTSIRMTSL